MKQRELDCLENAIDCLSDVIYFLEQAEGLTMLRYLHRAVELQGDMEEDLKEAK